MKDLKLTISKKGDKTNEIVYYASLSPKEGLAQLEFLRSQYLEIFKPNDSAQGFQRVYSVTRKV